MLRESLSLETRQVPQELDRRVKGGRGLVGGKGPGERELPRWRGVEAIQRRATGEERRKGRRIRKEGGGVD